MAEVIQFPCPACGASLRLPHEMAGIQGPCPSCGQELIAPDPTLGSAARLAAPESLLTPPEDPDRETQAPETPAEAIPETPSVPSPEPRPSLRVFPILLTALLCLFGGYLVGIRTSQKTPPAKTRAIHPEAPASPTPRTPSPTPEPQKASAAAEAALKAFLDAPDWATRAAHVLSPEIVRPAMEAYSHKVPDGPTPYQSVAVQNSYTDPSSGCTLFIFMVITKTHPEGIPVAVVETDDGWQIDWQTFIEFRDDLFNTFADGPTDASGRFHLIVSAPPVERAAKTENEHFSSFLLDPPLPGRQRIAYVRKSAKFHTALKDGTANGNVFTPVLEITKRETPSGKTYLEITGIAATDWLPEGS